MSAKPDHTNYQPDKPTAKETVFDAGYIPLLASEREARLWLLSPWRVLTRQKDVRNKILPKFVDPYVARELHRQEERDKELRDAFDALFGKKYTNHVALLLEAQFSDQARRELEGILLKLTLDGNEKHLGLFVQAMALLRRRKQTRSPNKLLKATVLLFVLSRRFAGEPKPTRDETDQLIENMKVRLGNDGRNTVRDIYCGPILGYLAHRVGRPRKGQKNSS